MSSKLYYYTVDSRLLGVSIVGVEDFLNVSGGVEDDALSSTVGDEQEVETTSKGR